MIDHDLAPATDLDARILQPQIGGIGRAAGREQHRVEDALHPV
jgi:hypothetical protein